MTAVIIDFATRLPRPEPGAARTKEEQDYLDLFAVPSPEQIAAFRRHKPTRQE
jgi:hypothetical protein